MPHPTHATVCRFSSAGPWHLSSPPNGCCPPIRERVITEREIYSADYYGRGPKLYITTKSCIQTEHGLGPWFGFSNDGHPDRIAAVCRQFGFDPFAI